MKILVMLLVLSFSGVSTASSEDDVWSEFDYITGIRVGHLVVKQAVVRAVARNYGEIDIPNQILVRQRRWNKELVKGCHLSVLSGWILVDMNIFSKRTLFNAMRSRKKVRFKFDRDSFCNQSGEVYIKAKALELERDQVYALKLRPREDNTLQPKTFEHLASQEVHTNEPNEIKHSDTAVPVVLADCRHVKFKKVPNDSRRIIFNESCSIAYVGPLEEGSFRISGGAPSASVSQCKKIEAIESQLDSRGGKISEDESFELRLRLDELKQLPGGVLTVSLNDPYPSSDLLRQYRLLNPSLTIRRLAVEDTEVFVPGHRKFTMSGSTSKLVPVTLEKACDIFSDAGISSEGIKRHITWNINANTKFVAANAIVYRANFNIRKFVQAMRAETAFHASWKDELIGYWNSTAKSASNTIHVKKFFSFEVVETSLKPPTSEEVLKVERMIHRDLMSQAALTIQQQVTNASAVGLGYTESSDWGYLRKRAFDNNLAEVASAIENFFCRNQSECDEESETNRMMTSLTESFKVISRIKVITITANLKYDTTMRLYNTYKENANTRYSLLIDKDIPLNWDGISNPSADVPISGIINPDPTLEPNPKPPKPEMITSPKEIERLEREARSFASDHWLFGENADRFVVSAAVNSREWLDLAKETIEYLLENYLSTEMSFQFVSNNEMGREDLDVLKDLWSLLLENGVPIEKALELGKYQQGRKWFISFEKEFSQALTAGNSIEESLQRALRGTRT